MYRTRTCSRRTQDVPAECVAPTVVQFYILNSVAYQNSYISHNTVTLLWHLFDDIIEGHCYVRCDNWRIDLDEHIRSRINQSIATDCRMFRPRRSSSTVYSRQLYAIVDGQTILPSFAID